ncbi:MAG: ABC transporter substrate-binding protein [Phototrophicales bacterium]|nr:MAG: ABC transporter substrate-binding protein [Phototrophicales bacterium]
MRRNRVGWLLLSPALIILFLVGIVPFIYVLYVGFFEWNLFSIDRAMNFIGVNNYRRLVFDERFLDALWVTIRFTFFAVISQLVIGFFLAQSLLKNFPGKALFRVIHTLPLMIAPISIGAIWRLLTIPGFGPIPFVLQSWFNIDYNIGRNADQAFLTIILMDIWHWTPFVTLTLLAGLSALPAEPREAAMVDGANSWQIFRYVTLPLMRPIILTVLFIRIMDALRTVDEINMLSNGGGPGTATRTLGIHIFRVVFPQTDYGYGSAMSLLTLYFTIVICWLLFVSLTQLRGSRGNAEGTG